MIRVKSITSTSTIGSGLYQSLNRTWRRFLASQKQQDQQQQKQEEPKQGQKQNSQKNKDTKDVSDASRLKNYYEILEIPPDATSTEIREAYYNKAKELHPDVNPSPLAKLEFEYIQEAFSVLKSPRNREHYNKKYNIEKTMDEAVEELEKHWMTKKKATKGPRMTWSEKLAKDMMRASVMRRKVRNKRPGESERLLSIKQYMKREDKPLIDLDSPLPNTFFYYPIVQIPKEDKEVAIKLALILSILLLTIGSSYWYIEVYNHGSKPLESLKTVHELQMLNDFLSSGFKDS